MCLVAQTVPVSARCNVRRVQLNRAAAPDESGQGILHFCEPAAGRARLIDMNATAQRTRDAWLALRCQSGEADAFRELVAEMERPLLYFATKVLSNEDAALDVMQQAWLRVFRTIRRLQQPELLRPWLYQIVRGLSIDYHRKRTSVQRVEQEYSELQPEAGEEPSFDQDDAAVIHRALDQLEPRLREVLLLHFLEELPIADVATIVACPEGTVKSRLHHAKRMLRTLLQGERHD